MSGVCLYRGQKVPLWVVRVAPVDVRAKLSIRGIIRITISVFSITEEIGTERGQELGTRPPLWLLCGPASSSVFLDAKLFRKIYV
jgi:hypothetical protein